MKVGDVTHAKPDNVPRSSKIGIEPFESELQGDLVDRDSGVESHAESHRRSDGKFQVLSSDGEVDISAHLGKRDRLFQEGLGTR